ncbi:MAG: acyloxyacyl hydrolase [Noviherbaspirillum sp.]|nr:acyloxyacyl hydrolase [Noviherbaspirillum sp.]
MTSMKSMWKLVAAGFIFTMSYSGAHAVDSASFELGEGDQTDLIRGAMQWEWTNQWFQSNGTHIGGYWDLTLAHWHAKKHRNIEGNSQNIVAVGITPVFRFQRDTLRGPYVEAGIGAHYLSDLYDNNDDRLSTRFQFGDHVGIGYVFKNKLDIGLKYQHFSNGGLKKPNSGVDFVAVRISYPF